MLVFRKRLWIENIIEFKFIPLKFAPAPAYHGRSARTHSLKSKRTIVHLIRHLQYINSSNVVFFYFRTFLCSLLRCSGKNVKYIISLRRGGYFDKLKGLTT